MLAPLRPPTGGTFPAGARLPCAGRTGGGSATLAEPARTLAGTGQAERVVRRSRFRAHAAPVADAAALAAFLAAVRAAHPGARHVPYAWVAGDGSARAADDGEPAGTGGRPCLAALARHGLRAAAVAVARDFGGIRLGAANLGRAYAEAADAAVRAAGFVAWRPTDRLRIRVPYAAVDPVERALVRCGAQVLARDFGQDVQLLVSVARDDVAALVAALPRSASCEAAP
jgi:putative IMPACT (imprinted ancient) family translation regulator